MASAYDLDIPPGCESTQYITRRPYRPCENESRVETSDVPPTTDVPFDTMSNDTGTPCWFLHAVTVLKNWSFTTLDDVGVSFSSIITTFVM
jgi:hypothetical protein